MPLRQAACCTYEGFSAYGDGCGIMLENGTGPSQPCVRFVCKGGAPAKGIIFAPAHAALRSVVLEHERIIAAANEQDMVNPAPHQLIEGGVAEIIFRSPVGDGRVWHIVSLTICKVTVLSVYSENRASSHSTI